MLFQLSYRNIYCGSMNERKTKLRYNIAILETYLKTKLEIRDWHGVADAAMDIRELEAQLRLLEELEPK